MREILFRGKRVSNGDWIFGGFHSRFDMAFIIGCSKSLRIDGMDVLPETVGQYAGMTDKNGTKIFEGDIVKVEYIGKNRGLDGIAPVVFDGCMFGLVWGWHKELHCLSGFSNVEFEVIGNIHDNPELLKGGAENVG